MGNNHDPVTLHKYLYANVDPVNNIDPSGNFSMASLMTAVNTIGTLSNIAQTTYSIFKVATGEEEFSAGALGTAIIFNMLGSSGGKMIGLMAGKIRKACNSFEADTLVVTEFGLAPIKDIRIGDKVWAYNEEREENSLQNVVHLIQGEGVKELVDIKLESGEVITATIGHPFYLPELREWANAGELIANQKLLDLNGLMVEISDIHKYTKEIKIYNLTVDGDHTYYIGENKVLSHNQGICNLARLTQKSLDHIFKGNKKGGFHHRAGGINPAGSRVLKITQKQTSGKWKGAYKAKVEICDDGKCFKKESTFFPDSWNKTRVQGEINSAYLNALSNDKKTGLVVGKSSNGSPIEMFIRNDEIITAYPKF